MYVCRNIITEIFAGVKKKISGFLTKTSQNRHKTATNLHISVFSLGSSDDYRVGFLILFKLPRKLPVLMVVGKTHDSRQKDQNGSDSAENGKTRGKIQSSEKCSKPQKYFISFF